MDQTEVKISVKTPNGKIKRILSTHSDFEELKRDIEIFLKETDEAIKAGQKVQITCSKCCNSISFKDCFKLKNKTNVKTGDNKLSIV